METEAKFSIPDQATFDQLREQTQIGPYTRGEVTVKQDHDRYVDTPDRRFFQQGWAARLRDRDGTLLMTLKGTTAQAQGAIHAREEYQVVVPGLDVSEWPAGRVRELATEIAGNDPLTDLVQLDQTRYVALLRDGERAVAEWSVDAVTLGGPDGPVMLYELEAELLPDGTADDLDVISRVCRTEYGLTDQPQSKLERALRLAGRGRVTGQLSEAAPVAPPGNPTQPLTASAPAAPGPKGGAGVLPTDSMAAAGRKLLRVQYAAMRAAEEGTCAGDDPEALHDMRVATRRMRALLRVADLYYQGRQAARVGQAVRQIARALGAVRDLDVLLDHARRFRSNLPAAQQADLDGLLDQWTKDRNRARRRLIRLLESPTYARATKRLQSFVEATDSVPAPDSTVTPYQVRHVAGSIIWTHYEAVRAYETVMAAPIVDQLHALRISGKYLRYTLEFFTEVLGAETAGLIRDVVQMQDQLGALHDADVAAGLVRDYIKTTTPGGKKARAGAARPPGLVAYLAEREQAVHTLAAAFGPTWTTLTSLEWRSRLAGVIAAL